MSDVMVFKFMVVAMLFWAFLKAFRQRDPLWKFIWIVSGSLLVVAEAIIIHFIS